MEETVIDEVIHRTGDFYSNLRHANEGTIEILGCLFGIFVGFVSHIADSTLRDQFGIGYFVFCRKVFRKFVLGNGRRETLNENT